MRELDIKIILANSPQAKGRVVAADTSIKTPYISLQYQHKQTHKDEMSDHFSKFKRSIPIVCSLLMAGCASTQTPTSPDDPHENMNRKIFAVNMAVDKAILRPTARVYADVIPVPLQSGIHNAFSNFNSVSSVSNDVLQGKMTYGLSDAWRILINTTVGIGGLFDVASKMGLPKHNENFGLTLAYWSNTTSSPYGVLPFFGPSTNRDSFGSLVDIFLLGAWRYIRPLYVKFGVYTLEVIDKRAQLMDANQLIDDSFDPYIFVRDAYLQTQAKAISDNRYGKYPYPKNVATEQYEETFIDDWDM